MEKKLTEERLFEIKGILEEARNNLLENIANELPNNGDYLKLNEDYGYIFLDDDPNQFYDEGVPRTMFFDRIIKQDDKIFVLGVYEDEYVDSEDGVEDFKKVINNFSLNALYHIVDLLTVKSKIVTMKK